MRRAQEPAAIGAAKGLVLLGDVPGRLPRGVSSKRVGSYAQQGRNWGLLHPCGSGSSGFEFDVLDDRTILIPDNHFISRAWLWATAAMIAVMSAVRSLIPDVPVERHGLDAEFAA